MLTVEKVDDSEVHRRFSGRTADTGRTALGRADVKKSAKNFYAYTATDHVRPPVTGDLPRTTLVVVAGRRRRIARTGGAVSWRRRRRQRETFTRRRTRSVLVNGWVGGTTVIFPRSSRPQTYTICYAFAQLRFSKTVKKACWLVKFSDKSTSADSRGILRSLYTADGTRFPGRPLRTFYEFSRKPGYCYRQIIVKSTDIINRPCTLRTIYTIG